MKTITVEDIYIELEPIFDENESGYERRLKVYKLLNNLLPKWEGNKRQKSNKTTKQTNSKALHIVDVSNNEVAVCDTETESICDRCGNWSPDSDIECKFCKQNDC